MLINKTIETKDGTVQFQGELAQDELDFILEIGLNIVMANGAVGFLSNKNPKVVQVTTQESTAVN